MGTGHRRTGARTPRRDGAVLGVVLVTLVVVTCLGLGLLQLAGTDAMETSKAVRSERSFWLAEAGLTEARVRLAHDRMFRISPRTFESKLGGGTYRVRVTPTATPLLYHVTSVGALLDTTRNVESTVRIFSPWHESFMRFALFGGGLRDEDDKDDKLKVEKDSVVSGDVYHNGKIEIKKGGQVIDGLVYGTGKFKGDGSYETGDPADLDPPPRMPGLDTTYYDTELAKAHDAGKTQVVDRLNIDGGTLYVDGSIKLKHGGRITGPGTLVVAKDVHLDRGVVIDDDVTIIAGHDIKLKHGCTCGVNAILYANKKIEIKDEGAVLNGGVLISPREVKLKKDSTLNGVVIYAGDKSVKVEDNTTITGAIVSGAKIEIKKDSEVTHDPLSLPETVPIGLEQGASGWTARAYSWREFSGDAR